MSKPYLCNAGPASLVFHIERRGIKSPSIHVGEPIAKTPVDEQCRLWQNNMPIYLPAYLTNSLSDFDSQINTSEQLYRQILAGIAFDTLLDKKTYLSRFAERFELLSTRFDESDRQELISVDFDVMENGELLMEDIWIRVSWLSFIESDESLRFRFSFGMEGFDDVSQDLSRQLAAAELCDCVFPESDIICKNKSLKRLICEVSGIDNLHYVERIVYYNAKNGGAQFHHDAEKGHVGVVYAQLTGKTLWLTLAKKALMTEIRAFLLEEKNRQHLRDVIKNTNAYDQLLKCVHETNLLETLLDDPANEEMNELLNESSLFFSYLVDKGYAYVLSPGDVILLPQESIKNCAWHSVFCLGDQAGQSLSFAIKACD